MKLIEEKQDYIIVADEAARFEVDDFVSDYELKHIRVKQHGPNEFISFAFRSRKSYGAMIKKIRKRFEMKFKVFENPRIRTVYVIRRESE